VTDAQAWLEGLGPEAEARLNQIKDQLLAGNVEGAKAQAEALKADAECAAFEWAFKFGRVDDAISYDFANGVANASIDIPCRLREAVPVTFVSWNLQFGALWGTSPQGRTDMTDTVWVQDPGTYTFQVDLPRPTTNPEDVKAALRQVGLGVLADGDVGSPGDLVPDEAADASGGGSLLDAFDIDAILAALTPDQISGLLDFICPFQVDLVASEASTVPENLGGQGSSNVADSKAVSLQTLIDGGVGQFPVKNGNLTTFADLAPQSVSQPLSDTADRALVDLPPAPPLSAAADEGDGDTGGGGISDLLGGLDFSVLCVDTSPAQVAGEQATPESGVSVLDAGVGGAGTGTGTLPRTGSDTTPGLVATGIGLILAGWLVLAANAFLRVRERTLQSRAR